MKISKLLKGIYPIILSVIILYFLYRVINPQDLLSSFKTINIKLILIAIAFFFFIKLINTFRYGNVYKIKPSSKLYSLLCYSNMMLSIIPFRLGELSYIHGFKKHFNKPYEESTQKLVLIRFADYLVVYLLLLI